MRISIIFIRPSSWYGDVCPSVLVSVRVSVRQSQFSALFSYMLWHIALKFCIWLCFTVLQIKFECHQFPSIFVGVMPLLKLRILQIHSFLHFSPTCFNVLSWNFVYDFQVMNFRPSSSAIKIFNNFCRSYAPFGT